MVCDGRHVLAQQYVHSGELMSCGRLLQISDSKAGSPRSNWRQISQHDDGRCRVHRWILRRHGRHFVDLLVTEDFRHFVKISYPLCFLHIRLRHACCGLRRHPGASERL